MPLTLYKERNLKAMNLPNKLTVLRVILIPFFVAAMLLSGKVYAAGIDIFIIIGLIIFAAASITDWFDGKIARKRSLVTTFGKFLDPLADKILVVTALVCFLARSPMWIDAVAVILILAREFMVSGVRLVVANEGVVVPAGIWGKLKTAFTMIAIVVIMLLEGLGIHNIWINEILIWIAALLTVASGIQYLSAYWKYIDSSK